MSILIETINIKKIDDVQSNMNLLQKHTNEIAQAAKENIFSYAASHIITNTASDSKLPWTGGAGGNGFAFADMQAMAEKLDDNKILQNNRFVAMSPSAKTFLSHDDYLKNWFAVNQNFIQNGQLPQLAGFGINPTVLVPKTKADGTISDTAGENTKISVVGWRRDHMNLVIQTELEITGSENAKLLGFEAAFTIRYGLLLERDIAGVVSTQQ